MKECYFYLDSTPTHCYMKALYKYPQAEYPYTRLIEENRRRGFGATEFDLTDAGVFDQSSYFDVFAEYAKSAANDILIRITVENRGPNKATLHVLPTVWFPNTRGAKSLRSARASRRLSWSTTGWRARGMKTLASISSPTKGTRRRFSPRMKQMRCAPTVRRSQR